MEKELFDKRIDKSTIKAYYVDLVMRAYSNIDEDEVVNIILEEKLGKLSYSSEEIEEIIEEFKIETAIEAAKTADFVTIIEEATRAVAKVEPKQYGVISKRVELLVARKFSEITGEKVTENNVQIYGSVRSALNKLINIGRIDVLSNPDNERYYLYQYIGPREV